MTSLRTVRCIRLSLTTVLASLIAMSACDGDNSPATSGKATSPDGTTPSASVSIPLGDDPDVTPAVRAEIASKKAADPNVDLTISEDGSTVTGDPAVIDGMATSLTDKYSAGNEAMGLKWYCLYNGGACGGIGQNGGYVPGCHSGKYLGSFFAWNAAIARQAVCGSGSVDVKSGSCPTDGSCLPY